MKINEIIVESSRTAGAEQVWDYVRKIHPDDQQGGGFLKRLIMRHPQYELKRIPLSSLHIPDQELDDEEQPEPYDPYGRAMFVDPDHAGEYSMHHIDTRPIVIDTRGNILDGSHRAWAAAELMNKKDIMAYVPVMQIREQGVTEAFDQPYSVQWTKKNGDWHATADLDDGSELIVLFMSQGDNQWMVEFERDENMEITGEGDAPRVFATVLLAMQQFIAKRKPAMLNFSAEKEDDPTGSRARLYDRMIQRYITGTGYDLTRKDYPGGATYTLTKQVQGVAESENNDTAISLSKLGKFHPGADSLAEFVPERATARYALHPDKWESTFYSLTNKDSDKLKYYGPKKISIPPGTLVGDMAIANKFYRAKTPEEKQQYAELYKASLQPYPVDVSAYRMPELLIPRQGMAEEQLDELFQPGKQNWTWKSKADNEAIAKFTVGDRDYAWQAFSHFRDDKPRKWEIQFHAVKQPTDPEKLQVFGTTGTGNSAEVMSIAVDIMREFLQYYGDGVQQIAFDAKENSRIALYRKMIQRLLPNWNADEDYNPEYGLRFILTRPKSVAETRIINAERVDVYYRPVPTSRGRRVVARNILAATLDPLLKKLSEKYAVPVSSFEWSAAQGVAENIPQPGESSGAPKKFGPDAKIQTRQMTVKQIISSVPGLPYYNNVVDDWDAKDYSWGVTKKVIEYATYLKQHPESLSQLPPILVLNGKFEDGAHRVSAIWLLQQRMDPKNPLWANAKLNVQFVKQGMAENASGIDFDMTFDDDTGSFATVTARAQGRVLGSVKFFMDGDTLEADMVEVDERYRGQGIAAAMYDYAKAQGYTVEKSDDLTPDGEHFWTKNRGEQAVWENFADGRNPQDKGDAKRHGVPTKASVSTLRKVAKQGGRKGQLAHWMANMKAGKAKKNG